MRSYAGQGATEYLVLLAIVLIVALVSVALLGFFPGMASDSKITQSQMYWRSASPVSIVESGAIFRVSAEWTYPYLRIKNSGVYPIRITGIVGGDGTAISIFCGTNCQAACFSNISDFFYLGPGEEKYFSWGTGFGTSCDWQIMAITGSTTGRRLGGASSLCQNSNTSPGTLAYKSIGFEYIQYIDGQPITKRQIGKDLIVKCLPPV